MWALTAALVLTMVIDPDNGPTTPPSTPPRGPTPTVDEDSAPEDDRHGAPILNGNCVRVRVVAERRKNRGDLAKASGKRMS